MKCLFTLLFITFLLTPLAGAANSQGNNPADQPDLVIGIMVDQMRHDYITRFWDLYGDDGIKRLYNNGFSFDNNNFRYVPTYTAPGHTSVYTGTHPEVHGIIANNWFDKERGESVYCTDDHSVDPVGTDNDAGRMSPHRMITTTITDELRLATNMKSRTIGIAIKDRSAIFPAGHTASGAYWFDSENGHFVTSSFYRDALPEWVTAFNERDLVSEYMSREWDLLLDESYYDLSRDDDNPYESPLPGGEKVTFPYNLQQKYETVGPALILQTPFGNDITTDLAIAAIEGEELGTRGVTDFLAVSYSSPDYIGHRFGPHSREIQDQYLRFDRDIARFLAYIDENIGRENVLIFMTADHGAAHVSKYMSDLGIPAGYFYDSEVEEQLREFSRHHFGTDLIRAFRNQQVFLDQEQILQESFDPDEIENKIARFMRGIDGVAGTLTAGAMNASQFTEGMPAKVQRGHHEMRSGDVVVWLEPQWVPFWRDKTGTTHFSPYSYDTRVPLIWYGGMIQPGKSNREVGIEDIAPTLGIMLRTSFPNGSVGQPLEEILN